MKKYLSIILLGIVLLSGCFSPYKNFDKNTRGWKPADFNPGQGILLIEKAAYSFRQQSKIEQYVKEKYPYKYTFCEKKQLTDKDSDYKDKNVYRWILAFYSDVADVHANQMNKSPMLVRMADYYFIDRLNDKKYPATGIGSSWPYAVIKKIIENITKK